MWDRPRTGWTGASADDRVAIPDSIGRDGPEQPPLQVADAGQARDHRRRCRRLRFPASREGDGSVIGGIIGLRLEPGLLSLLAADRQVVLVTGTNGKTTTTRLITAALTPLGQEIASNIYGANMEAGLTSALSRAPDAPIAVLETDEKYIPAMVKATNPKVVVLLNLSRDQMDRAAEIWLLARRWREALAAAPGCRVVANADDPLVAWAASSARQVTWVAAGQRWREDSWCCPNCGSHLQQGR